MTETIRCPDCGHPNPATNTACERCNYPLGDGLATAAAASRAQEPASAAPAAPPPVEGAEPSGEAEADPLVRPFRPIRPRRPRPEQPLQLQLWLVFGVLAAMLAGYSALRGFHDSNFKPIEGAQAEQQKRANEARAALAKDSTNVDARIALADILYDTGNWREAIVHYKSATRMDSSRVTALVDLGVCYYNLGDSDTASRLFELALTKDPHQPVALFNLGIVAERAERWEGALQYYHRAMQSGPPDNMRQPLMEAMQRVQAKTGKVAPPLR